MGMESRESAVPNRGEVMPFLSLFVPTPGWSLFCKCLKGNGGDDETRTRHLCRDSGLQVLSTTWKSTDGTASHSKGILDNANVYRDVHRVLLSIVPGE